MLLALRIAFGVFTLAVLVAGHIYLYRRLVKGAIAHATVQRVVGLGLLVVLSLLVAGFARYRSTEGGTWALLFPSWLALVVNLLLVAVTLDGAKWMRERLRGKPEPKPLGVLTAPADEGARAAPLTSGEEAATPPATGVDEQRRHFLRQSVAAATFVAGGGLTAFGAYRAYEPARITEVPIRLPGLPKALEGFTLVQLTDVHIGPVLQERYVDDLVERARLAKGDLIAVTGDLVDGSPRRLGAFVARLMKLQARYGTWFVTGNHDYYSGADAWVDTLAGLGVATLRNRYVSIGQGKDSFDLIGVDDWGHGRRDDSDYDLDAALAGRDPTRASVLLAHQPSNFDAVAERNIGLQVSGHTHGGQMFPATVIGQLIWGERNAGLSRTADSQLFVSRGCGFVGPPQRGGSPPEIAKLILLPA